MTPCSDSYEDVNQDSQLSENSDKKPHHYIVPQPAPVEPQAGQPDSSGRQGPGWHGDAGHLARL